MFVEERDVFLKGDCDASVEKMCELLNWKEDLISLQTNWKELKEEVIEIAKENDKTNECKDDIVKEKVDEFFEKKE